MSLSSRLWRRSAVMRGPLASRLQVCSAVVIDDVMSACNAIIVPFFELK